MNSIYHNKKQGPTKSGGTFSIFNKIKLLEKVDKMPLHQIADKEQFDTIASNFLDNS